MKIALWALLILSVNSFAKTTYKTELPREHGFYFLGATSSEIIHGINKEAVKERAEALCKYMGFKRLVKANSTILPKQQHKVNDIQKGNLVSIDLWRMNGSGVNQHAVINELECSK